MSFSLGAVGFLVVGLGLVVVIQLGRRRPLRQLWSRDRAGVGGSRAGKVGVASVLLLTPAYLTLHYLPSWVDDSWIVLVTGLGLVLLHVVLRRLFVAVAVTAVLVAGAMWALTPQLSAARSGDAQLLARLTSLQDQGSLSGFQDLAVADVDLQAAPAGAAGHPRHRRHDPDGGRLRSPRRSPAWSSPTRSSAAN